MRFVASRTARAGTKASLSNSTPSSASQPLSCLSESATPRPSRRSVTRTDAASEAMRWSACKDGVVLNQSRPGGTRAKPKTVVRIVISNVQPRPVARPSHDCTPGYAPCLPPASDYDCRGGSGNGPKYSGPVRVTGSDPYDLDRDRDGKACEWS
jgi:hypothetical protein